jgi:hypothetical protein
LSSHLMEHYARHPAALTVRVRQNTLRYVTCSTQQGSSGVRTRSGNPGPIRSQQEAHREHTRSCILELCMHTEKGTTIVRAITCVAARAAVENGLKSPLCLTPTYMPLRTPLLCRCSAVTSAWECRYRSALHCSCHSCC